MAIGIRQERALVRVWRLEVRQGRVQLPETVIGPPDRGGPSHRLARFRARPDGDNRQCIVLQVYDLRRRTKADRPAADGEASGVGRRWRVCRGRPQASPTRARVP